MNGGSRDFFFENNINQENVYKKYSDNDEIFIPFDSEKINNIVVGWVNNEFDEQGHKREKESYYKKILSNRWDIITDWSIKLGNNHFAVTINLPEIYINNMNLSNYDSYGFDDYNEFVANLEKVLLNYFKTITFFFVVGEKNKKGNLHLHMLISIKNFIDYSYCLRDNLLNVLKVSLGLFRVVNMCDYDIKVQNLRYFKDIKNWSIYLYKDMRVWRYPGYIYCTGNYSDFFYENLGDVMNFYLMINFKINNFDSSLTVFNNFQLEGLFGVILKDNVINQGTLINLLQYYLILKNYYIYNDNIYKKLDSYFISYEYVNTLESELYENFQENIILFYTTNFNHYFDGFDFNYLLRTYFIKSKNIINSIKDIITNKIKPDFCIMEFKDGLYFIKYDRFIPRKDLFKFNNLSILSTLKYYDKNYNWVRKNEPKGWISGLLKSLDINTNNKDVYINNDNFRQICLYLANVFHKNIFIKKLTLYVFGESNTRKTTLIVLPLVNYFGEDNIGRIVSTKNFKLQGLEGKVVGILDEFKYTQANSGDFLKLLGGEGFIVEKKYSKDHIMITNISIIIISNTQIKDNDERINEALYNRMSFIEFFNPVPSNSGDKKYIKEIKNEEANIIVYCNKIFFKKINNEKKFKQRFNNKNLLEDLFLKN